MTTIENSLIINHQDDAMHVRGGATVDATNNTFDGSVQGVVAQDSGTTVELTNNLISFHSGVGANSFSSPFFL